MTKTTNRTPKSSRTLRSDPEPQRSRIARAFVALISPLGWHFSRRCFPSFFLHHPKSNQIALVMLADRSRNPKGQQRAFLSLLSERGIPVFRWTPKSGFSRLFLQNPDSQPMVRNSGLSDSRSRHVLDSALVVAPPESADSHGLGGGDYVAKNDNDLGGTIGGAVSASVNLSDNEEFCP